MIMKHMNKGKKMIPVEFKYAKKREHFIQYSPQGNCYSTFEFTQNVLQGYHYCQIAKI